MRLFVGIPIAASVVAEIAAMTEQLKRAGDGLRWSTPEQWHITLQFLGDTTEDKYACAAVALRGVKAAPVMVRMMNAGCFEHVFYMDVALTDGLSALQRRIVAANAACGFGAEERPYHPHVTLARARRKDVKGSELERLKSKAAGEWQCTSFVAEEFILYESVLGPGGSRYEARERVRFNG